MNKLNQTKSPVLSFQHTMLPLSASDFLDLGLLHAGFDENRNERTCDATKLRRFRSFFGLSPQSCIKIFSALESMDHIGADRVNKPDPLFFLITMDWLSTYKTEEELAGSYNMVVKTIHKRIWEYALAIQANGFLFVLTLLDYLGLPCS